MARYRLSVLDYDWIDDSAQLDTVIATVLEEPVYAIDTEFHRERTYYPELALVQLAWPGGLVLIDPLAVDVTPIKALLDRDATAVIHAASQDLQVLYEACGIVPTQLFDPQLAALFCGFRVSSLGKLVQDLLGVRLDKSSQLSDWRRRPLPKSERAYAASDVAHLLELRGALTERLEKRGRLAWAEEEMERLRTRDLAPPDPETLWWKLKGKAKLSGTTRGVAQSLAAWRERTARADNRPPKTILPDMALLAIAHRPPRNAKELGRVRGIDGRHLNRASDIIEAVQHGRSLDRSALRLPPSSPRNGPGTGAIGSVCLGWITQQANAHDIDPSMLATRDDVTAFVSRQPSRLDEGWRHELVGESLRAFLDGSSALAVRNGNKLVSVPSVTDD